MTFCELTCFENHVQSDNGPKAELYVYKDLHTQKNNFTLVTETNSGYFKQKVGRGLFFRGILLCYGIQG